jgi:hypothetical protein
MVYERRRINRAGDSDGDEDDRRDEWDRSSLFGKSTDCLSTRLRFRSYVRLLVVACGGGRPTSEGQTKTGLSMFQSSHDAAPARAARLLMMTTC